MFGTSVSLNGSYECVNSFKIITHVEQVSEFLRLWALDDSEIRASPHGPQQDASPHKLSVKVEACLNQLSPLLIRTLPPDPSRLVAGSVCFAIIDARLYRVRLLTSPKSEATRVVVQLIDHGNEETVKYSDLRSHDSEILNYPPLALPYYLDCFKLFRLLTLDELNGIKKRILYKKKLVRSKTLDDGVDLIDVIADHAVTLTELLASENLGYRVSVSEMRRTLPDSGGHQASAPMSLAANQDTSSLESRLSITHPPGARNLAQNRLYKFQSHPPQSLPASGGVAPLSIQPANYSIPPPNQPVGFMTTPSYHTANLLKMSQLSAYRQAPQHLSPQSYHEVRSKENCTSSALLMIGSCHDAYVTAVNDGPYQFAIQLKTDLENTLPTLKAVLARHPPAPITAPLIPGSMVMAQKDNALLRAVVSKVESDSCVLYFVDYGKSETLPSNQIFKLQPEAAECAAALGLQFRLSGLKSMNITEQDKEYFKRLVLNKRVSIVVKDSDAGSAVLCQYCDMFIEGENVKEMLGNWRMPLYFAPQCPPPERDTRVTVCHVDGPTTFFVQYDAALNLLSTIQEAVQSHCISQSPITDVSEVPIGSAVGALYADDGAWYRSMIVDFSNDNFTVLYIDYGNRCDVRLSEIRRLNRELVSKWKCQAVECCLVGFDTLRPDPRIAEAMERVALGKFFTMRLYGISNGTRLKVDLIDPVSGTSTADIMKREYDRLINTNNANIVPTSDSSKPADGYDRKTKDSGGDDHSVSSGTSQKSSTFGESHGRKPSGKKRSESGAINTKGGKSNYQENRYQRPSDRNSRDKPPPLSNRRNNFSEHDDRFHEDYNGGSAQGDDSGGRRPYGSRGGDSYDGGRQSYGGGRVNRDGDDDSRGGGGYRSKFSDSRGPRFGQDSSDRPFRGGGRYNNEGSDYSGNKFGGGGRRDFTDRRGGDDGRRGGGYKGGNEGYDNSYQRKSKFDNNRGSNFGDNNAAMPSNDAEGAWDVDNGGGGGAKDDWGDSTAAVSATPATPTSTHPEVMEFPKRELDGSEYSVLLAQLEAPDVAYVQMADCEPILEEIRAEIDADTEGTSRPCSIIKKGLPVLAVFDVDGLLYRAIVRDSTKPEVLYVDYGNSAAVSKSQIFTITPKLAEKPPQAIRVVLSDVIGPPGATSEWPAFESETYEVHYGVDPLVLRVDKLKIIDNELVVYGSLKRPDGVDVATALVENRLASFVARSGLSQQTSQDISCVQNGNTGPKSDETTAQLNTNQTEGQGNEVASAEQKRASPIDSLQLLKGQYLYAQLEYKFKFDNLMKLKLKECEGKVVIAKCTNCVIQEGSDVIAFVQNVEGAILLVKLFDSDGISSDGQISPLCPAPVFRRKERVYLSSIEGPIVYFQKVSDQARLTTLTNELFEFYENCTEGAKTVWSPGEICCSKSYDGNWYRAEIVEGPEVTVRYLDFGNIETVSIDCVRELDMRFTNQSAIAVMASMPITWKTEDVGPFMDGQVLDSFMMYEDEMWLVDFKLPDGTRFIDMLDQKKLALKHAEDPFEKTRLESSWHLTPGNCVEVMVTHFDSPDLFWVHLACDIADVDALQEALKDVADDGPLGKIFAAKYSDDAWYRAVNEGEDKVRFIDYGNCDVPLEKRPLKCDKLKRPERGYAVKLRLCARPIHGSDWCDDAVTIFGEFIENEKLEAVVIQSDVDIVVDLKSGNELLSEKLKAQGYAMHWDYENPLIQSPCRAFFSDITSLNSFHVQAATVTDNLEWLRDKFAQVDSFGQLADVKLNQMVAAEFPDDALWYRAIITSIDPDSSTKRAYFIDFGNSSDVTDLRKLPEDVAAVPPCSIHCTLKAADELITKETRDKLEELGGFGGTEMNVVFRDSENPRWTIVETEDGTNIMDCLGVEERREGPSDDATEPKRTSEGGTGDSKEDDLPENADDSLTDKKIEDPVFEVDESAEESAAANAENNLEDKSECIEEQIPEAELEKNVEERVSPDNETERTVEDDDPATEACESVEKVTPLDPVDKNLQEQVAEKCEEVAISAMETENIVEEQATTCVEEGLDRSNTEEDVPAPETEDLKEQTSEEGKSTPENTFVPDNCSVEDSHRVETEPAVQTTVQITLTSIEETKEGNISPVQGQCKVTHINSGEDMYIQDLSKASLLQEMMKSLDENAPILTQPKPGDHGFVIDATSAKRCSVISVDPPSVFLYDYGTTSSQVSLSDIHVLPVALTSFEPLAILCTLGCDLTPSQTATLKSLFDDNETVADFVLDLASTPPTVSLKVDGCDLRQKIADDSVNITPLSSFQRKRDPLPVKTVEEIKANAKPRVFDRTGKLSPSLARRQSIELEDKLLPGCVTGISST